MGHTLAGTLQHCFKRHIQVCVPLYQPSVCTSHMEDLLTGCQTTSLTIWVLLYQRKPTWRSGGPRPSLPSVPTAWSLGTGESRAGGESWDSAPEVVSPYIHALSLSIHPRPQSLHTSTPSVSPYIHALSLSIHPRPQSLHTSSPSGFRPNCPCLMTVTNISSAYKRGTRFLWLTTVLIWTDTELL